ncbi:MAG: DUF6268 family outer membrane beta-barrel protein [Woeseiaceae bacterium]|nr:DUF6268 family outer membrane beta-barrel protein [Woeseiaceae bacterium]
MTPLSAVSRAGFAVYLAVGPFLVGGPAGASGLLPPLHDTREGWLAAGVTRVPAATLAPVDGAAATVAASEQRLSAASSEWRAGPLQLRLGLDYAYTRYEYERVAGRNRDLHRLALPVNFRAVASRWEFAGYVAPGVATSSNVFNEPFTRWSSDDVTISAAMEARREIDGGWQWLAGLAYDRRLGGPGLYPLAGIRYRGGDALSLRIAVPDSAVRYAFNGHNRVTLRIRPAGETWHVVSDELREEFDYRATAYRVELTWHARLWGPVALDIGAGYETGREHRFTDDTATRLRADADSHWLFTIGLSSAGAPALP